LGFLIEINKYDGNADFHISLKNENAGFHNTNKIINL